MGNTPNEPACPQDAQEPFRTGPFAPEAFATAPFAAEQQLAVATVREAGALVRARFQDEYDIQPKGDEGDVVTDLDLLAERLVVQRIHERYPHDRILAEESGTLEGDGGSAPGPRRTWLVDPLDGSNNVVIGLPAYVVGVALCVDDEPVVGVIHDPVTDRTWSALTGCGAYGPHGRMTGPSGPLAASGPLLAWTQGHAVARDDPAARTLKSALEVRSRRLLQLWAPLLTWSMLARGDIDGFVGYRAEAIDFPAGALLAAEAGLEIRALDGGVFQGSIDGPDIDRSFVAGRPQDMPYLLDLVSRSEALDHVR
ncbi:inositol monophosphatase [Streptomyces caniferus]|uniref:Inositol monophosphatase n=1 Tax=Streptomyces caniferus TaxID=285557 RepID=A0A640SA50_9ACTN|nr:inositol monophosphatase [Streptomyces caniferus]GFE07326.1 inositol monophosphatase [Streptomyces caniferus]